MFRFDNILEHWASIYKPISHRSDPTQKHNAFYRVDVIDQRSSFVCNFNTACSPAIAFITRLDANFNGPRRSATYTYGFYLMIKQEDGGMKQSPVQADNEAAECKAALSDMLEDLLVYLSRLKRLAQNGGVSDKEYAAGLAGLQLDNVSCATVPERYNNWWLLGVQIDSFVMSRNCIVEERYEEGSMTADGTPVTII